MRKTILIGILLPLFLAACASGPRGPLDLDNLTPLGEDYGYLAIGFDSNVGLYELRFQSMDGGRNEVLSREVRDEKEYRVYRMQTGEYRLTRFVLYRLFGAYTFLEASPDARVWEFEVLPGKINYLGDVNLHFYPSGANRLQRMNNGAQFYLYLQENAPEALDELELVYAGPTPDLFHEWVRNLNKEVAE